jgi:hypothetical protein
MAMDLTQELTAKFGPANGDGEFLVGMVDLPLQVDEGTVFGRTNLCLRRAVTDLGFPRRASGDVDHRPGGASISLLPGVRIAVQVSVAYPGRESVGRARVPTADEQAAWVASRPAESRGEFDERRWWAAGFDRKDAQLWRGVAPALTPGSDGAEREADLLAAVLPWKVAGFDPTDAAEWARALAPVVPGVEAAHEAREWRDHGFASDEAAMWAGSWPNPGESPQGAKMFRDLGWNPFDVWLLDMFIDRAANPDLELARRRFALMDPALALDMARAGMSPTTPNPDNDLFDELSEIEWATRLRESFAERTPVADICATYVDHYIWVSYGTELPDDLPFRHEPLKPRQVQATRAEPAKCPESGGRGIMLERDGWDEWWVRCPECGTTWAGGGTEPLPEHTPVR